MTTGISTKADEELIKLSEDSWKCISTQENWYSFNGLFKPRTDSFPPMH